MPATPISMRKLKEILRLKYGCQLSHRQIGNSLSISASAVSRYTNRAAQLGITHWPLAPEWDDAKLQRAFMQTRVKKKKQAVLDWALIHQELKSKTMTLQLLWEEYQERNRASHYSYTHFCRLYKEWQQVQSPSMRQNHKAGEKLFIDYCGPTINVIHPKSGEIRPAQVFVAVLGASNYTYVEATWSQRLEDWTMSHARCFEFLGGVPELVIPDNLKSAVNKPCRYDPDINPTYQQLACHYDTVIIPARPHKPKDKAKVEVAVQIVERWIMAKLRHERFYSLRELNQRIRTLLIQLNEKPLKKLPGSRLSQFQQIDKPALKPLPTLPYSYTQVKQARVQLDYHVKVDKHYYSVPYRLLKKKLEVHISGEVVKLFYQGEQVAIHPRSHQAGCHSTQENHRPEAHRRHGQWTLERFEQWAHNIGPETELLVRKLVEITPHLDQTYRAYLGLLRLSKKYSDARLNTACARACAIGIYRLSDLRSILEKGLDTQPLPVPPADLLAQIEHQNIRGNHYYH